MSTTPPPGFAPEEVLNIETFSADVERERYFRFGPSPRAESAIRRHFEWPGARHLARADKIMVLSDRRVEAIGRHEELMSQKGTYPRLCALSFMMP